MAGLQTSIILSQNRLRNITHFSHGLARLVTINKTLWDALTFKNATSHAHACQQKPFKMVVCPVKSTVLSWSRPISVQILQRCQHIKFTSPFFVIDNTSLPICSRWLPLLTLYVPIIAILDIWKTTLFYEGESVVYDGFKYVWPVKG